VHGGECGVRLLGGKLAKRGERKVAAGHGTGNGLERADFRRRQSEPRQPRRARTQDGRRIERVESRGEPSPDRVGARDRKLLRHDDGRKPGEPVRPPAQRRSPGRGHKSDKPGIDFSERAKSGVEIGLSVNV